MSIEESRKKLELLQVEIMNRRGGILLVPAERVKKASELRLSTKKASLTAWKSGKREVRKREYSDSE